MAAGIGLILAVVAAQVYGGVEQARLEGELAAIATRDALEEAAAPTAADLPAAPPTATLAPTATPQPTLAPTATESVAASPTAPAIPTETAAAAASPTPPPPPSPSAVPTAAAAAVAPTTVPTATPPAAIRRILAPRIGLDAGVVAAPLRDGQWDVPKFLAGHLEGTSHPGQAGNVVLSGHVQSISSGNVFARIPELTPDDRITLRTNRGDITYVVRENRVVPNDDLSVIRPTLGEILTLITCTGTFDVLKQDYSHRVIIVADHRA